MPNFTEFLAASPVCEYHISNQQSALKGVLFSPSIEGGCFSTPSTPPLSAPAEPKKYDDLKCNIRAANIDLAFSNVDWAANMETLNINESWLLFKSIFKVLLMSMFLLINKEKGKVFIPI